MTKPGDVIGTLSNSAGLEIGQVLVGGLDPGTKEYTIVHVLHDHARHYTDPAARKFAEAINAVGARRGWR